MVNVYLLYIILLNLLRIIGVGLFVFTIVMTIGAQQAVRPNWNIYPIYKEARKSLMKNDYKTSIDLLNKAIIEGQNNPDHLVWVYEELAGVEMLYGEPEKAFEYLQKIVNMGFGKTYYQYSFLTRSRQYKFLWQLPKWKDLLVAAKSNFVEQIKSDGDTPDVQLLFQEDQADRLFPPANFPQGQPDQSQIALRARLSNERMIIEWMRQKEMKKLIKEQKLKSVRDYHSAVFIFQHSGDIQDIKLAKRLAFQGYELAKDENERCGMGALIAVTTDRLLWYQGKPQIYGTQSRPSNISFKELNEIGRKTDKLVKRFVRRGEEIPLSLALDLMKNVKMPMSNDITMTLDPIDKTKITDLQRKKFCTRPLEQSVGEKVKGN